MFRITENKGFHIVFPNGLTLSTQIGGGNHCSNYRFPIGKEKKEQTMESPDAEIAIWDKNGKWVTEQMLQDIFPEKLESDILGYVTIDKWIKIFEWCVNQKKKGKKEIMRTYKVKVKTTNALKKMTKANWNDEHSSEYYDCEDGILFVITDDPRKIYDKFSKDTVIEIEDIGIGYIL